MLILQFAHHFIYDIEVAVQIKSGIGIMETLAGIAFVKDVESLFRRNIQPLRKTDGYATDTLP